MLERVRSQEKREEIEADLMGPPLPLAGAYLFGWFIELSNARGPGALGPAPITYPDIDAWSRLTRRAPAPWEVRVIKALDGAYLRVMGEKAG